MTTEYNRVGHDRSWHAAILTKPLLPELMTTERSLAPRQLREQSDGGATKVIAGRMLRPQRAASA